MAARAVMIAGALTMFILLSALCVPIFWLVPRALAFDAVALWTLGCLVVLTPATALWLLCICLGLPVVLRAAGRPRPVIVAGLILLLVVGLVGSRSVPDLGWVGGAFFTLRALHVVIEWWMGRIPVPSARDSLRYFLFLPVMVAGPINRLPDFQHQMRRNRWDTAAFMTGAERLLFGLVSIRFLAGVLGVELRRRVDTATADWAAFWSGWALSAVDWVNLYLVFAGATHVALGIALMMGVTLEENFNRPWSARSLIEFWQRWHMSLTGWVQDYVFRPLTALTRSPVIGLACAMLVVGLWHEISVYYVLWSFWQTLGIVLARVLPGWGGIPGPAARLAFLVQPIAVLAWLSAARPVIGLFGVSP